MVVAEGRENWRRGTMDDEMLACRGGMGSGTNVPKTIGYTYRDRE